MKYQLFDYGVYTNMVWNCGAGAPFRIPIYGSYLSTHLSFSLALLGPLLHLWDRPSCLALIQWLMMLAGVAAAGFWSASSMALRGQALLWALLPTLPLMSRRAYFSRNSYQNLTPAALTTHTKGGVV